MKLCSACGKSKELTEFNRDRSRDDGLYVYCKDCRKEYRQKNRDSISAYWKEYREKNRDDLKEYRQKNRDSRLPYWKEYYEKNRDRILAYTKEWKQENRTLVNSCASKSRAKRKSRSPTWAKVYTEQFADFFEKANKLTEETGVAHHVDHIIPLIHESVSGLHVPWNLQVLPAKENISKGNKWDGTYDNEGWKIEGNTS